MSILVLDLETSPDLAHVWGRWQQNIASIQVEEVGRILCWCAKWTDEDEVIWSSAQNPHDEVDMLEALADLINQAEMVVAHNGDKFDLRWVRTQMIRNGLKPFAPVRTVDTLKICKQNFRFPSNKLADVAVELKCSPKSQHSKFPGFELWKQCIRGNPEAWEEMVDYCAQDVVTLQEVFEKLRPWAKLPVSMQHILNTEHYVCDCGSEDYRFGGYYNTKVGRYRRVQCKDCGTWGHLPGNLLTKEQRQNLVRSL